MKTKTTAFEDELFPYTDIEAPIRFLNGEKNYVGIGTISLGKNASGILDIRFDESVEIRSSRKPDELTGGQKLEVMPAPETFARGRTEQLRGFAIVRATDHELRLRSKNAEAVLYLPPSVHCGMIRDILSRCK